VGIDLRGPVRGSHFTGAEWIAVVGAKTAHIERGSPWENSYIGKPPRGVSEASYRRRIAATCTRTNHPHERS